MLYSRRERKTFPLNRWLTLAIVGVTVGGGIAAWLTSPRIESITPEGGDISSLTPITIRFTQSMNRSSVENHFHIEPKIEGAFSWIENQMTFTPSSEWKAGAVRVTFDSGATSESGLPMLVGRSWQFNVTAPRIAFLFKINEVVNLWVYPIGTEELIQMTKEGNGVGEYAISPDGTQIVYSALRKDGGADLKRVSRDGTNVSDLVSCPNELCAFPVFSFDGKMLAFERTPLKQTATRIEVIEATTAKTVTPILDPNYITRTPFFARDGRLAYVNDSLKAIFIYDFNTRTSLSIPNTSGESGTWSPDGKQIVFPEIFFSLGTKPTSSPDVKDYDKFYSHLQQVTVTTHAIKDLSVGTDVEDSTPIYSPSGEWIAFGRRRLIEALWTPGKQLWIMKSDGSETKAVTNDALYNHSAFGWSPNGKFLIYMRFNVADFINPSEIWMVNANGSGAKKLITGGYFPQWLP